MAAPISLTGQPEQDNAPRRVTAGGSDFAELMRLHDHRLLKFCQWLAANSDKFVSATFGELDPKTIVRDVAPGCLRSPLGRTIRRYCEQAAGRLW